MSDCIHTIGYEGRDAGELLRVLKAFGIDVLVDVRERPMSRKKGFGRTALSETLSAAGKVYVHMKALGSPSELRRELKESGDYRRFFAKYRALMSDAERVNELDMLEGLLEQNKSLCLMCFEKDVGQCHRKIVAETMQQHVPGLEVVNL